MSRLHMAPGEKQSGEQSHISWAYSPKVVRTNEIARSVIITCVRSTSLTTVKILSLLEYLLSGFDAKSFERC